MLLHPRSGGGRADARAGNRTGSGILICLLLATAVAATAQEDPPIPPDAVLNTGPADTLRTNLMVAEALLGDAFDAIVADLPLAPASVLLVPFSTDPEVNLLTTVATHRLLASGHHVHVDQIPLGTDGPVYELRYRVDRLDLGYPDRGRRFLLWGSWVDRAMDLVAQFTLVDQRDNQVVSSRRVVRRFQDRVPADQLAVLEAPLYPFTSAPVADGGWVRRLEEIVVLGTLAGLVAIYFANTE